MIDLTFAHIPVHTAAYKWSYFAQRLRADYLFVDNNH